MLSAAAHRCCVRVAPQTCSVRGHVWQLLLGVSRLSASSYSSLVALGPCSPSTLYSKIRGDVFRTFQDDAEFWELVKEEQLSRVLNAFVHQQSKTTFRHRSKAGERLPSPFTYLQGMNAIAGAFLFCMTEIDAFSGFRSFIVERTPLYWLSSHIGANAGCKLVDQILSVVDPQLAAHLSSKTPGAYVYAFHCVSGFCSTIRPLSEVLRLWDFLLAFGPHFNLLCVAAQVVMLRSKLLESENPKAILDYRVWPRLQADLTISVAMSFLPLLSAELYTQIVQHATNIDVAEKISETHMHENCKDIVLGWQQDDSSNTQKAK